MRTVKLWAVPSASVLKYYHINEQCSSQSATQHRPQLTMTTTYKTCNANLQYVIEQYKLIDDILKRQMYTEIAAVIASKTMNVVNIL